MRQMLSACLDRKYQSAQQFLQLVQPMFDWKISAKVTECQGLTTHKSAEYSLLLGLDDRFSNPSPIATACDSQAQQNLAFNTQLTLSFKTDVCELPSSQLQLILVVSETQDAQKGIARKQEIIGIATITIFYPLQEYLKGFRIFRFEKSLDPKATIKAEILLQVNKRQPQFKSHSSKNSRSLRLSPKSRDNGSQHSPESVQPKKKSCSNSERSSDSHPLSKSQIDSHSKYAETIKALTQQRNQLYKMSEDLYSQLKQCSKERDQYLKELREKELSEEQVKAQLEFLKLKVYQYEETQSLQQQNVLQQQLWELKALNQQLQASVQQKQKIISQLQRKVRESLIALHDFKEEALTARSELIHKQSQLSFISKQSRNFETVECIQQLVTELQQRNFQQPFQFKFIYEQQNNLTEIVALIKKDLASLFTKLLGKLKIQKEKEWLLREKVQFERGLQERVLQFSTYDHN